MTFRLEEQALLAKPKEESAAASAPKAAQDFPRGRIGKLSISRLICGGNLISGFAHSRDLIYVSPLLKRYFTDEKVLETLALCEAHGINTAILRLDENTLRILKTYWKERGGKIQWIAQCKITEEDVTGELKQAVDGGALGAYVHGGVGDSMVENKKVELLGQAVEFVKQTGVDALAIAIGTSHGAYKFSSKPTGETLKMQVLIDIHNKIPNTHLVMHGSSSVPKDLQDIINQYGGKLKPTWGVPVEEIQLGIRNGVRKINVDTDNRLAITGAIRKVFSEKPEEFDPRSYLKPAREAMKKVVALRMTQFGQAGHAKDYTPISLAEMAARY